MRYYGWNVDKQRRSRKERDAIRHRPTRRWYTRYLHRIARMEARKELARSQEKTL
jgi:predicted methyltransferase